MKKILLFYLFIPSIIIFAQEDISQNIYTSLEGIWNSPSNGDMNIILNITSKGEFTLSITQSFNFTNKMTREHSKAMKKLIPETGYFKIIDIFNQNEPFNVKMEILWNGELSTNNLEINENKIFIINTNSNLSELFLSR
ncbi:MAG: hypothetical protein KFW21_02835 [Spirochaetota bacterium]|nr:hypothetical protein [Spirochaetota bacterium]